MNKILRENHVEIWLSGGYIDDLRYLTSEIEKGKRWSEEKKCIIYKEEWKTEDEKENLSREKKTSNEIGKIMNSVLKELEFTTEIKDDFANRKLPTLDFELWIEKSDKERSPRLLYSFYEKPMGTRFCVKEESAMAYNSKRSALAQEVIRRRLNTSEMVPQMERNNILERFVDKLRRSGYNESQTREILVAGLSGYENKKNRAEREQKDLHRDGKSTLKTRAMKKLTAKNSWYKKSSNNKEREAKTSKPRPQEKVRRQAQRGSREEREKAPTAVFFVPRTQGGELATLLREAEIEIQKFSISKIKIVEETGDMVKNLVHKANPWAGEDCAREKCPLCSTGDENGDCRRRNIVYQTQCLKCKTDGRDTLYVGESSRTAYERGIEHQRDWQDEKENSHMHVRRRKILFLE